MARSGKPEQYVAEHAWVLCQAELPKGWLTFLCWLNSV